MLNISYNVSQDLKKSLQKIENMKEDDYTKSVLEKYKKIENSVKQKTKKQFFNSKIQEYSQLYPNLNNKQILSKVKNDWRKKSKCILCFTLI